MIVDLFGGPGGWEVALRRLGHAAIGLEWDRDTCATRVAAELPTIRTDVAAYPTEPFRGRVAGLIASPPCPAFSNAGRGHGTYLVPILVDAVIRSDWGARPHPDPEVWLVLDVGRWITDLHPEWIALEQVPAVLPIWRAYAHVLGRLGYDVWTGVLNAADYGVPQTRQRAILTATRSGRARAPIPTHTEAPTPRLFGDEPAPWVSVEDALGWSGEMGFPRRDEDDPTRYRDRDWRPSTLPAFTLTGKAGYWTINTRQNSVLGRGVTKPYTRSASRPAPTITTMSPSQWDITNDEDGTLRKLTTPEALLLQSFPADYPVRGSRSSVFAQIGNAIPPSLAEHVLRTVVPRRT